MKKGGDQTSGPRIPATALGHLVPAAPGRLEPVAPPAGAADALGAEAAELRSVGGVVEHLGRDAPAADAVVPAAEPLPPQSSGGCCGECDEQNESANDVSFP